MIKDRVIQVIEFKGVKKEEFFPKIGMTSANFRGSARNTPLNSNAIENILSIFTDISPEWLLTGTGTMFRIEGAEAIKAPLGSDSGIPLIPVSAFAGISNGEVSILEYECERYIIPIFKDAEFMIPVKGGSMIPKYNSGDIVACKRLPLSDIFFQWNKVYVIDTDQGVLVKRIHKAGDPDKVKIVSENPDYEPFELPIARIRAIAIVIGVVRLE